MDTYDVLVIILSVFLAVFLIISIVVAVMSIMLIKKINRTVDSAKSAVSNLGSASSIIKGLSIPVTLLGTILSLFKSSKKGKEQT